MKRDRLWKKIDELVEELRLEGSVILNDGEEDEFVSRFYSCFVEHSTRTKIIGRSPLTSTNVRQL